MEVIRVAADHDGAFASGCEHHRRIDDIRSSGAPAENARGLGEHAGKERACPDGWGAGAGKMRIWRDE
jgi:hypothetical protein